MFHVWLDNRGALQPLLVRESCRIEILFYPSAVRVVAPDSYVTRGDRGPTLQSGARQIALPATLMSPSGMGEIPRL